MASETFLTALYVWPYTLSTLLGCSTAKVKLIQNLNITVVEQTVEHLHLCDLLMQAFTVGWVDWKYKNRAHGDVHSK